MKATKSPSRALTTESASAAWRNCPATKSNCPKKRRETLALVVNDLFPEGGDLNQALFWSGLRPMTPDSTPLIGRTRFENLFLNTGHGTLGWTMSLGSAKLTADIVSGKDTEIRSDDLSLSRYQLKLESDKVW